MGRVNTGVDAPSLLFVVIACPFDPLIITILTFGNLSVTISPDYRN
jgi:hypothetical protein